MNTTTALPIWLPGEEPLAVFSPCLRYRYFLTRRWAAGGRVCAFIGLNPSTADETRDDPTIRRCIGFAKRWGFQALYMLNLFAYRSTSPNAMKALGQAAVGVDNDAWLERGGYIADFIVCAWGVHGGWLERDRHALQRLRNVWASGRLNHLGLTRKTGFPRHPLYVPGDSAAVQWRNPVGGGWDGGERA